MLCRFIPVFNLPVILSVSILTAGAPALAGDNNTLFIEQTSSGGLGNSLFVDQSQATGAVVAGNASGTEPATQTGGGNVGSITMEGLDGLVIFNQSNPTPFSGTNTATIQSGSLASVVLQQQGFGNVGTLDVAAGGNSGSLTQIGNDNDGTVNVSGTNTTAELSQTGNQNVYLLDITGNGTTVQWNQVGNATAINTPAQVISNVAGTVTVTQQSF